jgi:hypothetical protein
MSPDDPARPDRVDPDELRREPRAFIAEMARGAMSHASVCETYAEIGNDVGLIYAARCVRAYLRGMGAGIEELERVRALARYRASAETTGPGQE